MKRFRSPGRRTAAMRPARELSRRKAGEHQRLVQAKDDAAALVKRLRSSERATAEGRFSGAPNPPAGLQNAAALQRARACNHLASAASVGSRKL